MARLCLYVCIQDKDFTALRVASAHGQTEVTRILLERGAAVDFQDKVHTHQIRQCTIISFWMHDIVIYKQVVLQLPPGYVSSHPITNFVTAIYLERAFLYSTLINDLMQVQ